MKTLFNGLSALATPIGSIIHVGAGQCSELQSYQDLNPQKIILIEADIQQLKQLKSITQSQKNIHVLACAVADKKAAQTLKILTNQRDNSLLMPDKILDYYPSLALASEQTVTTETLNDLLQDYVVLDKNYHHLLIIEVQGLESLIIKSTPAECLQQFSGIIIRSGHEQLYKQEQQENIIELLEPVGFEHSYQENEQYSAVFNKLYFQRNNEKISLMHCTQQINELNTVKAEQTKLAMERRQQLVKLTEERDAQVKAVADKQREIEQINITKAEQIKLATERQKQVVKLTEERDVQAKAVADKQTQIGKLNAAKAEQTKLATDYQQQVAKLTQERDLQTKTVTDKQTQIEQLSTAKAEQTKLATERQQQVAKFIQERDAQTKAVAGKQTQIEQLNAAKAEQAKLATERQQQLVKLTEERDAQVKAVADKQREIEQLNTTKTEQTKLAMERQQQVAKLTQERDAQTKAVADKQTQIEQSNTAKAEQEKLLIDCQQKIAMLTKKSDLQAKNAIERQGQIDLSNKAKEEQSKLAAERQQQIQKLTQECDIQIKQGQAHQTQLTVLNQNIDQLKKRLAGLEGELNSYRDKENKWQEELEEAKQTASLSVKLQMLKEGDLKDLQKRYQLALITQENQHELLNKLSERLSLAAGYFHQIAEEQQAVEENKIAHIKNNPRKGLARFFNFKLGKRS